MNKFSRTRALHQYYRDVFTKVIDLPDSDRLPAQAVAEILQFRNTDLDTMKPIIMATETGLSAEKEAALKAMMYALTLANNAFDVKNEGQRYTVPPEMAESITNYIVAALQSDNSVTNLVVAIQILFRINEIESALFLISNNLSTLSQQAAVLKILLLICLMEEDDNQLQIVIQHMTADSELIGEDPFTLLMIVCGIYKLGGCPDSYIDFTPLQSAHTELDTSRYQWLIPHSKNGKTTVLIACDKGYFLLHAKALVASVYETNGCELNVHLHIYNCDDGLEAQVNELAACFPGLALSLSHEEVKTTQGINVHYASRRFVFMSHALEVFAAPILLLDADCLVRNSWQATLTALGAQKLFLTNNESAPLWERVQGGFLYAEPDTISQRYLDIVARFIDHNLMRGNVVWFLDQVALSFAVDAMPAIEQMSIGRVAPSLVIDTRHHDQTFSWVVTTYKKGGGNWQQYKTALCEKYFPAH